LSAYVRRETGALPTGNKVAAIIGDTGTGGVGDGVSTFKAKDFVAVPPVAPCPDVPAGVAYLTAKHPHISLVGVFCLLLLIEHRFLLPLRI
jgi:hypothetical protein